MKDHAAASRRRKQRGAWRVEVDGSFSEVTGRIAYAAVLYDPSGRMITRRIAAEPGESSLHAEAQAILLGITTLREVGGLRAVRRRWVLVSDCRGALELADRDRVTRATPSRDVFSEIHRLRGQMASTWVPRRKNRDADQCAQRAHRLPEDGLVEISRDVPTAVEADMQAEANRLARMARRAEHERNLQRKRARRRRELLPV